jgi:hypothetical protein
MSKIFILVILALTLPLYFIGIADLTRGLAPEEITHALFARQLHDSRFSNLQFISSPATPSLAYSAFTSIAFSVFDYGVWQLRVTSALAGTASAIFLYFLTYKLFRLGNYQLGSSTQFSVISFLVSIIFIFSPWSIHFSRFASAHNLGLTFYLLGMLLFVTFLFLKSAQLLAFRYLTVFALGLSLFLTFLTAPYFAIALLLGYVLILSCFVYRAVIPYLVVIYLIAIVYLASLGKLALYFSYYNLSNLFFGIDLTSVYRVSEVGLLLSPFLPFLLTGLYRIAIYPDLRAYFFGSILGYPLLLLTFSPKQIDYANALILLPYFSLSIALGLIQFTKLLHSRQFAFRFSRFIPRISNFIIFIFFSYAFVNFWHIYHQHYPLDAWPQWSTHWTQGAIYITQFYPKATYVVMEESAQATSYVQFFDLVFHNKVSRTLIGLESAAELYSSLPDGTAVGIGGWRATPSNFQDTHIISLPDRQGSIIYKVGIWQK